MKYQRIIFAGICLLVVGFFALSFAQYDVSAQFVRAQFDSLNSSQNLANVGTGFSYQGYLEDGGEAVTDLCDFQFGLWDHPITGVRLGALQTVTNVWVEDGHFAVILNDGNEMIANPFDGSGRWLQITVRCPAGSGGYTELTPRQTLSAAPYAHTIRPGATISGTVPLGDGAINIRSSYDGIHIDAANGDGLFVDASSGNGLNVSSPDDNGVHVRRAINGMFVDQVSSNGVHISGADQNGMRVEEAGQNGIQIDSAMGNGVQVQGSDMLAGYFGGDVTITGVCNSCTLGIDGLNVGKEQLNPGDVVTVVGTEMVAGVLIVHVRQAQAGEALVGVVSGSAEITQLGDETAFVPQAGTVVAPNAYLSIITYGPAQVSAESAIAAGNRLTLGTSGNLRALQSVSVDGVQLAESAPTLGIALDSAENAGDEIWVFINPQ